MLYEFIEELRFELCKKEIDDIEDVLSYFEEMIKDRMENGEDIEAILADLGDPKHIADSLFGDQSEVREPEKKMESALERMTFTDVKEIITETVSYNFAFKAAHGKEVVLEYDSDEYSTLKSELHHGKLKIEQEFKYNGLDSLRALFSRFSSKGKKRAYTATLYIPTDARLDFDIENVSGDLSFSDLRNGKLDLDNVSGDLRFDFCVFEKADMESVSGDINMSDTAFEREISIDLVSGDLKMDRSSCPEIDIDTVSGDIDLLLNEKRSNTSVSISGLHKNTKYKTDGNASLKIDTVSGKVNYAFIDD